MPIINQAGEKYFKGTDPNAGQENRVAKKELSKDDFLKIFLTQMKAQNPLKPYDSTAMLQQMGQLTSLTATEELQGSIRNLNLTIGKSEILSASQLVGRKVQLLSDKSPLVAGEGLHGSTIVPSTASNVVITIRDAQGGIVKTIEKGVSEAGVLDFDWDGKGPDGKEMKPDFYQISAKAKIDGKEVDLKTAGTFKVNSVAMNPMTGSVFVNVDGLGGVDMSYILKII
jgi:flagellar basal-body rod modification protein FlgD